MRSASPFPPHEGGRVRLSLGDLSGRAEATLGFSGGRPVSSHAGYRLAGGAWARRRLQTNATPTVTTAPTPLATIAAIASSEKMRRMRRRTYKNPAQLAVAEERIVEDPPLGFLDAIGRVYPVVT